MSDPKREAKDVECDSCGNTFDERLAAVLAASVEVMRAWNAFDPYQPAASRPVNDADVVWSVAVLAWMEQEGITLDREVPADGGAH